MSLDVALVFVVGLLCLVAISVWTLVWWREWRTQQRAAREQTAEAARVRELDAIKKLAAEDAQRRLREQGSRFRDRSRLN